jgi:uncharacterized protein (TIGR02118 family)
MHRVTILYDAPTDPETFEQRYRAEHVPLVRALPGLVRFSVSHPRGMQGEAPYLVAELWFADSDTMRSALQSPEMGETGKHAAGLGAPMTIFSGAVEDVEV